VKTEIYAISYRAWPRGRPVSTEEEISGRVVFSASPPDAREKCLKKFNGWSKVEEPDCAFMIFRTEKRDNEP
jgi:hypothetical protein